MHFNIYILYVYLYVQVCRHIGEDTYAKEHINKNVIEDIHHELKLNKFGITLRKKQLCFLLPGPSTHFNYCLARCKTLPVNLNSLQSDELVQLPSACMSKLLVEAALIFGKVMLEVNLGALLS